MSHTVTTAMRAERRVRAEAAQASWSELSPEKQIECLDNRLGRNVGAKRQRRRLAGGRQR